MKSLSLSLSLLAAVALAVVTPAPSPASDDFAVVKPTVVQLDGAEQPEAKVFSNSEKTVFYVCVQGDSNLYEIHRKEKKVVALKRSSVLVKPDKCRPMDGAKEQPITEPMYTENGTGFQFNALTGKKIGVGLPTAMR